MNLHILQKVGILGLVIVLLVAIALFFMNHFRIHVLMFSLPFWLFILMGYLIKKQNLEKSR